MWDSREGQIWTNITTYLISCLIRSFDADWFSYTFLQDSVRSANLIRIVSMGLCSPQQQLLQCHRSGFGFPPLVQIPRHDIFFLFFPITDSVQFKRSWCWRNLHATAKPTAYGCHDTPEGKENSFTAQNASRIEHCRSQEILKKNTPLRDLQRHHN